MLVIRLNRFGKRNQAQFRVVLQERAKAPGHRHIEMLGSYNPHSKTTLLKKDRVLYWIGQGAKPSDRVHNMLVKQGIIEGKIIPKKMPRPVKKEEEAPKADTETGGTETSAAKVDSSEITTPEVKTEETPVASSSKV